MSYDSAATRARLLDAAFREFSDRGLAGARVDRIATAASANQQSTYAYFGSKDDLFVAALEIPVDPREALAPALAGGIDGAAERMLRVFLAIWDDPANRLPLLAVVRGAFEPAGRPRLVEGFLAAVLVPVGEALGVDDPPRRMPLVATQVIGLIVVRYVLEAEPLASMPVDDVVAVFAPTLQRYLSDPLP